MVKQEVAALATELRSRGMSKIRGTRALLRRFPELEMHDALAAWGHIPEPGLWAGDRGRGASFFEHPFVIRTVDLTEEEDEILWESGSPNPRRLAYSKLTRGTTIVRTIR